jgi:hypothetical protein
VIFRCHVTVREGRQEGGPQRLSQAHEQQWNKNERYGNISQSGQVSTFYVNLK